MRKSMIVLMSVFFVLSGGIGLAKDLTQKEKLGGQIYRDQELSLYFNQACMTCHHPSAGFADPANQADPEFFPVSEGSDGTSYGGRNAPTSAYAGFSPVLEKVNGTWIGGMFWDGRATGWTLDDPLAEQAQGPFENPVEMGIDRNIVVNRVATSSYASLFLQVYPDTDFTNIDGTYDDIARAIAAYERSSAVTKFNSKFDQFWQACRYQGIDVSGIDMATDLSTLPQGILTSRQLQGLALFNDPDRGNCAACHTTNFTDTDGNAVPPLFTDYTYANLGIPPNWRLYQLAGGGPPDYGLGGFLESQKIDGYQAEYGKFKVPTLRNVAKSSPYGHNGYFTSLEDIVHFLNTRDDLLEGWPTPEYEATLSHELGDLQLTYVEEASIVAFLQSLTDNSQ